MCINVRISIYIHVCIFQCTHIYTHNPRPIHTQGESTEKQLTRVLQKELSEKIHKKLKWSTTDLQNAAGFAEYLKQHPLPTSRSQSSSRLQAGNDAGDDSVTSKRLDDGVIKVTFKREMTMTDKQYREMEDAMQDAYSKSDEPVADAGKSTNTARLSKIYREATQKGSRQPSQAPRLRKIFRDEDAPTIGGGSRSSPVTESQSYAENILDWHQTPLQDNYVAAHARAHTHTHTDRTPEMSTVPRSQGEEVKDILEEVLGVSHRDSRDSRRPMWATSPSLSSLAAGRHSKAGSGLLNEAKHLEFVPEEASKHVKYTSGDAVSLLAQQRAKLSAREHGEFVHLPPRHEMVPRSVQPYYWKTLPATARAEVQSEHHQ